MGHLNKTEKDIAKLNIGRKIKRDTVRNCNLTINYVYKIIERKNTVKQINIYILLS